MQVLIATIGNYRVFSDFGTSVLEGTLSSGFSGPGTGINFFVEQIEPIVTTARFEIVPVTGSYADFWNSRSNVVGGAPAEDAFDVSFFLSFGDDGTETASTLFLGSPWLVLNADNLDEHDETFLFRISESDVFGNVQAEVLFTVLDDDGSFEPTGDVEILGIALQGEALVADASEITDGDGLGIFSFQWLRDGETIADATGGTYLLSQADVGASISVRVDYTDGARSEESLTSSETAAVVNINDAPAGSVIVTGTATQGEMLTADTSAISDEDGLGTFSFQWLRDGAEIADANGETYNLTQSDVGSIVSVRVTYRDGFGATESLTSSETAAVVNINDAPAGSVIVTGTATQGEMLTADASAISDEDGLGTFSFQWLRDGAPILRATGTALVLGQVDVGAEISVRVSYTDGEGSVESLISPATLVAQRPGTEGNDVIVGGLSGSLIEGFGGNDTLIGGDGDDTIAGGDGDDSIEAGGGNDNVSASEGDDVVLGGSGNDNIGGGLGNDTIDGGDGDDVIGGGFGADSISGGADNDVVAGGADNDTLSGGDGNDSMSGSFGNDLIDAGSGADDIGGGTGRDIINAGSGNDRVGGGEGDDSILGGAGNDFLAGGGRDDNIDGGTGNDTINGGAGNDVMTGGADADQFVFSAFFDGESDVITDFEDGIDIFFIRIVNPDTGVENINNGGNGLAGFVTAMNVIDTDAGAQMSVNGNTILVEGITAAQLTVDDFQFL